MSVTCATGLDEVRNVYSGPEGDLWELIMGQQIHVGGFKSSMDLAERAGIEAGQEGIDLCCCNGAGMRFLVHFRDIAQMTGVDATETVVRRGEARCAEEGLGDRIRFVRADVCASGQADFVWGEDAWVYVVDKSLLIAEAARLVKPRGTIAFTDWVTGPTPMSSGEMDRFLAFVKCQNCQSIDGYTRLLEGHAMRVVSAADTGRFAPCVDLYLTMIDQQFTFDALRILDYDSGVLQEVGAGMEFLRDLAHAGKIIQGRFIANKD